MINKDKGVLEYSKQLASKFLLRLPDGPAKALKELLNTSDDLNNHLAIRVHSQRKHGEVRLDNWDMRAEIIDLPLISDPEHILQRGPEISQMLVCTLGRHRSLIGDSRQNTIKETYSEEVRKYMWPHGVVPPSINMRKRAAVEMLDENPEIKKDAKKLFYGLY